MTRYWLVTGLIAAMGGGVAVGAQTPSTEASPATAAAVNTPTVTFHKDVLPILQKNCQTCHRPGEVAPMSFLTYQASRPWARAIKAKVVARQMPPWSADPNYGRFVNDRSLSQREIDTLAAWADGGAVEGNPADAPPPVKFPTGWELPPDIVVEAPPLDVPAKGIVELLTITIPSGFTEDTWVTSVEIRPGVPQVTHHICFTIRKHTPDDKHNVAESTEKPRDENGNEIQRPDEPSRRPRTSFGEAGDACYVPGQRAMRFNRTSNAAKLIPAGADFRLNIHYTPSGEAVTDRTRIGFTVAKEPPAGRFVTIIPQPTNGTDAKSFRIPANDPNYESSFEGTFLVDADLVWMMPHMHLRGKDMKYTLNYPDGRSEVVLNVPKYDFNWQLGYEPAAPIKVPRGTMIRVISHHDNSTNNKFNPNPNQDVFFGNMTWEEMMNPWFGVIVPMDVAPTKIIKSKAEIEGQGSN